MILIIIDNAIHDQTSCRDDCLWYNRFQLRVDIEYTQLIVPCRTRTGNLADADKWKIAFAILVQSKLETLNIQLFVRIKKKSPTPYLEPIR